LLGPLVKRDAAEGLTRGRFRTRGGEANHHAGDKCNRSWIESGEMTHGGRRYTGPGLLPRTGLSRFERRNAAKIWFIIEPGFRRN
jgi:hypothetical protein